MTENSRNDGGRVLCSFKCFISVVFSLPLSLSSSFSFDHRNILHYVYHRAQLFKKNMSDKKLMFVSQ